MSMDAPTQGTKPPQATKQPQSAGPLPGASAQPETVPTAHAGGAANEPDGDNYRTLEEALSERRFIPGEDYEGMNLLREALIKDLAPLSLVARLLAENLADLEIERRRFQEWSRCLVRRTFINTLEQEIGNPDLRFSERDRFWIMHMARVDYEGSRFNDCFDLLRSHNIMAGEHAATAYQIESKFAREFDNAVRQTEVRRRRLLADFERAQNRARRQAPNIPDAQLV